MKRVVFLTLMLAGSMAMADGATRDVNELYSHACKVCHESGISGAPKAGNAADWAPRLQKGMDVLLGHVKNGFNAMPPRGVCMDCTDDEYKALIEMMSKGS